VRFLRIILSVYFLLFAFVSFAGVYVFIQNINRTQGKLMLIYILFSACLFVAGTIFVLAWWSNWREWVFARRWAVAASLLSLLMLHGIPLFYYLKGWGTFWQVERGSGIPTIIGAAVLVIFSLPHNQRRTIPE